MIGYPVSTFIMWIHSSHSHIMFFMEFQLYAVFNFQAPVYHFYIQ